MDTSFKAGERIKNIDPRSEKGANFGQLGTVTDIIDGIVYVEYDNGDCGSSAKPEKYYQKVTYTAYKPGTTKEVSSPVHRTPKNLMNSAVNFVQNMTRSADDQALIDTGLMTECGIFTENAVAIVNQDAALAAKTRLVTVAQAMLAKRKADREEAR